MARSTRRALAIGLLTSIFAVLVHATPTVPQGLRVSDTPEWFGELDEGVIGISNHPHFRALYVADSAQHSATKFRVQLSDSDEFASLIWDSGFVSIAPTASGTNTPAVAYTGPGLLSGAAYFWRAACQDDQGVSGPYSAGRSFRVAEGGTPVDLRATTGVASETLQGNPVTVVNWPPALSAEHTGSVGSPTVSVGQVQVSQTADFRRPIWESDWLPVGQLEPGQRSAPIMYTGDLLKVGTPYFWRIRLTSDPGADTAWSEAAASFVQQGGIITTSAPAGFAKESRTFGPQESSISALALGDVNGNGVPDSVLVTSTAGASHVMYPDVGTATPGQPVIFGEAVGGRTLAAIGDFDLDGAPNVLTVDAAGLTNYRYEENALGVVQQIESVVPGEPVAIQVADTNWDGWPDIVVAYKFQVIEYFGAEGGFGEIQERAVLPEPITSMLVSDFNSDDGLSEFWIVSAGRLWLYRNADFIPLEWPLEGISHVALGDSGNPQLADLLFAGSTSLHPCSVTFADGVPTPELEFHSYVEHGFNAPCVDLVGACMDGGLDSDAVIVLQGAVLVMRNLGDTFELIEYVGHPGGGPECSVSVGDTNLDGHLDILIGRVDSPAELYFNRPRLVASISDTTANQVLFGEAYAEFVVTLSSAPVSMVEVECETYEMDPAGGGEDGDDLPDPTEMLKGQVTPLPYVPTVYRLIFAPGQVTQRFYVPLTSYYAGASWLLHARIVSTIGAVSGQWTATGSVYGVPVGGGGMPPTGGPPGTPGMQRDWDIHGEVRAIVEANGTTYIGGDFDGVSWQAGLVAAVTKNGERRLALPSLTSGQVRCVAVDPSDGSIYFGGSFTINADPTTQIKNIAKCTPAGDLVPGFAPNPVGVVNSIDVDPNGRVYFGGKFTKLEKAPVTQTYKNIAWVNSSGSINTTSAGSNSFGVANSGVNEPVLVLKAADSGGLGVHLLVGGQFDSAYRGTWTYTAWNYVAFPISGSGAKTDMNFDGAVRAIEVYENPAHMLGNGSTGFSYPIVIGGTFDYGWWGDWSWNLRTHPTLVVTDFNSDYYPAHVTPMCDSPVYALEMDDLNRLWVGRASFHAGFQKDPLALYTWSAQAPFGFTRNTGYSSGINATVTGLAAGGNTILATGSFSDVGGTPVGGMAALSTQSGNLGSLVPLGGAPLNGGVLAAVPTFYGSSHNGFLICGNFSEILAERSNLAALNSQGQLLAWSPRTNGPVCAMATDHTNIYFGGSFTSVSGLARKGLAAASVGEFTTTPSDWIVDVSGGLATVNSLVRSSGFLVFGGDFTAVTGIGRTDAASVNLGGTGVIYPNSWNPVLEDGAGSAVNALLADSNRVYVGGSFTGITGTPRPGLLAVAGPWAVGSGTLEDWDVQLTWPCNVAGIAQTANEIVFVGDFSSVLGVTRTGAACVSKSDTSGLPTLNGFRPGPSQGDFICVTATSDGFIYLGGDFNGVYEDPLAQPGAVSRAGVALLDTSGDILDWAANVLGSGPSERVSTIWREDTSGLSRIWVGGEFTAPLAGQDNLTWFSGGWYITNTSLPDATAGANYNLPPLQLSDTVPCTWSMIAPGAPQLTIDPTYGVIGGTAPSRQIGQWLPVPVFVSADAGGGVITGRLFMLTVIPPPLPTLVSIEPVMTPIQLVDEGNQPYTVTQKWTIRLNQAFSTEVHVSILYQDGTARNGFEYAPQVNEVVFYPPGITPSTNLPAGTLATNGLTVDLPVTIFGNLTLDAPGRQFTISILSLTPNVGADPSAYYSTVEIFEDDSATPRPAYVRNLAVREDAVTPGNVLGVVASQPWITWEFGSDQVGTTQDAWEVEWSLDPAFAVGATFSAGQANNQTSWQMPSTTPGVNYFVRVRVWPTGIPPQSPSDWVIVAFHRNSSPAPVTGLSPGVQVPATPVPDVSTARPLLRMIVSDDLDGDPQFLVVHLEEVNGTGQHTIDSRATPYVFDQFDGAWSVVGQSGIAPGVTQINLRIPSQMSFSTGQWDWWVDIADPFELVPGIDVRRFNVNPGYEIRGTYTDPSGFDLTGREVNAFLLSSATPLNSVPAQTGPVGTEFSLLIPQALVAGDLIAICVDPQVLAPGQSSSECACVIVRFTGCDFVDLSGVNRRVSLVPGECVIDARGQDSITLNEVNPPAAPLPAIPGYPLVKVGDDLQLTPDFMRLELSAGLRVRDSFASPGEPTSITTASPQLFVIGAEGALSVEEGAEATFHTLESTGSIVVHATAKLTLGAASETSGEFYLLDDGTLDLASTLTLNGGTNSFQAGLITGVVGTAVSSQGGTLTVAGTHLDECILEVGPSAESADVSGALFTPTGNDRCIFWRRVAAEPVTMHGVRFDALTGINVFAEAGTDPLTMVGCGGNLAGENYDSDPGEGAAGDIVIWETAAIEGLAAHSGDEKILLVWDAGAQTGTGFTFEIHEAAAETGPFTQIDTTSNNFYVHDQLTNDTERFYFVRTIAWGQQADSDVVSSISRNATLEIASPLSVGSTGLWPATVLGSNTHFGAATGVTATASGVDVPVSSVLVLSAGLLLFDIETDNAQEGTFDIQISTPNVWSDLGAPGYSEPLSMNVEVQAPPCFNCPRVNFIQAGGAVGPDDQTSGTFAVAVEFDDDGGAPIDPALLEAIVSRDIEVNSQTIPAGTNLADATHALWGTPTTTGASWSIDQSSTTIDPGELIISVRVANEYGFQSSWRNLRIFVEGAATELAFTSEDLVQGESGQVVVITCNDIQAADSVWFPDDPNEIQVTQLQVDQMLGTLTLTVDVGENAQIGSHPFEVGPQGGPATSWGTYHMVCYEYGETIGGVGGFMTMSVGGDAYPGPRAVVGGQNVVLQNGEFRHSATDIGIQGRGFSIAWDRHYRSARAQDCGKLGKGWFGTYLQYLLVDNYSGAGIQSFRWTTPTGEEFTFEPKGNFIPQQANFTPPAGIAVEAHVTNGYYVNTGAGLIVVFPSEIELRTPDRMIYVFGLSSGVPDNASSTAVFRLRSIEDAHRNKTVLQYAANGRLRFISTDWWDGKRGDEQYLHVSYDTSNPNDTESSGSNLIRWVSRWKKVTVGGSVTRTRLEVVEYRYSQDRQLTLQRLPDDPRHGESWQGYAYGQALNEYQQPVGPNLLRKIFPPTQAVPQVVVVPTNPPGIFWQAQETSKTPSVTVSYIEADDPQPTEYRVASQTYGSDTPTQSARSWTIAYPTQTPNTRTVTSPEGVVTTYVLNDKGQATSIDVGGATTEYEYDAAQALTQVTRPGGATTSLMYAQGNLIATGTFDIDEVVAGVTEIDTSAWGWQNSQGYVVELRTTETHYQSMWRGFFVVDSSSQYMKLKIVGDLLLQGVPNSGIFHVYSPPTDSSPLARFQVIQSRESAPQLQDRITTTVPTQVWINGRLYPSTSAQFGPHGAATFTVEQNHPQGSAPGGGSSRTVTNYVRHSQATTDTANGNTEVAVSAQTFDQFGRMLKTVQVDGNVTQTTDYAYYDAATDPVEKRAYLKSVTVSGTSAATSTTEYDYDTFGHMRAMKPQAFSGDFTQADAYQTITYTNERGQVWYVRSPSPGTFDSAGSPVLDWPTETWFFYDEDGRVHREITSWRSSKWNGTVTLADDNDARKALADGDIEGQFLRPQTLDGAGWVHTRYVYNGYGEVIQQHQDLDIGVQAQTQYEYDLDGRLKLEIAPEVRKTAYEYNSRSELSKVTNAFEATEASSTSYEYNDNGSVIKETDPLGNLAEHEYDGFGRLTKTSAPAAGGTLVSAVRYADPNQNNVIRTTLGVSDESFNRASWTEYDQLGREIRWRTMARNKLGEALSGAISYDGHPGAVSWSELNAQGLALRSFTTFLPGTHETLEVNSYDGLGRLRTHRDSLGAESEFEYDVAGHLTRSTSDFVKWNGDSIDDSVDVTSETKLDPAGQELILADELGKETRLYRHSLGWVEMAVDESLRYTETEFNFVGWPRTTRTGKGAEFTQTETLYDLGGLVIEEKAWPAAGQNPQSTTYEYDKHGRLIKLHRPDTGFWTYQYDAAGRLTTETRPDSICVQYTYDSAGNLVALNVMPAPGGSGAAPVAAVETQKYQYNLYGEVLSATSEDAAGNPTSRLTMEYNSLGLIESQELVVYKPGTSDAINVEILAPHTFSDTQLGFESLYRLQHADSKWTMRSTYDARGRERASEFWDGRTITSNYFQAMPNWILDSALGGGVLLDYMWHSGQLTGRTFAPVTAQSHHVVSPRPNTAGKIVSPPWPNAAGCLARFYQDPRGGLKGVTHHHRTAATTGVHQAFAGVDVRFDYSGNPVLERRLHQGGLSRIMQYDFASRLQIGLRGHLPAGMPGDDLPDDAPEYLDPVANVDHQWRRGFTQDKVDNITQFGDTFRPATTDIPQTNVDQNLLLKSGNVDERNLIGGRSDTSGGFTYDRLGSMTRDATTELHYEHNYRGQVTAIKSDNNVLRAMSYDCFGRMVHQVDAPGTPQERGTIFVPNVGFGGDGGGADTAAEVSYTRQGTDYVGLEVVQFTYGLGTIGGGIGWKRFVEFVAYCREFAPYYRFLHEDTMGNTVATTSLWGDRLDEYDYTDYGVPVHAPVALDGRWITDIAPHTSYPDVSVVTLAADMLEPNELIGCEIRVVKSAPANAGDVFVSGTVISHLGDTLHIRDVGNDVADAWQAGTDESHVLAAIFELREGFVQGTMDSDSSGTFTGHGWLNEPCTLITVDHGPFDDVWMYTQAGLNGLSITLGPDSSGAYVPAIVLGALDQVPGSGMRKLAVLNTGSTGPYVPAAFVGPGKRYLIDGKFRVREVAQSGAWAVAATSAGDITTFTVNAHAALTVEMAGWILQPDVNLPAYLPIINVNPATHTVTVAGNYAAAGTQGKRFRIFAMPGTVTHGEKAGVLMESTSQHLWVAAASSRCLYAGYRYEAPLAGTTEIALYNLQTKLRQGGDNFAGQHYTLHRHYDPTLMRFTSPDPAASPFSNLGAYCGNNPAGSYDPDGLEQMFPYQNDWENRPTEALINTGLDIFGNMLAKGYGGGTATVASGGQVVFHGENVGDTFVGQQVQEMGNRYDARVANNGGGVWGHITAMHGVGNDAAGLTSLGESITGRDNITGEELSDAERYNRFVDGSSSMLLIAATVAGPKGIPWASRIGGKVRVGGTRTTPMFRRMTRELAPGPHRAQIQYLKAMRKDVPKAPFVYKRPGGATTRAQRASVQGRPCAECGRMFPRMIADHTYPIVVEWYETGTIDLAAMRSLRAVRSHCPECSPAQGGFLRQYSLAMREHLRRFGRGK